MRYIFDAIYCLAAMWNLYYIAVEQSETISQRNVVKLYRTSTASISQKGKNAGNIKDIPEAFNEIISKIYNLKTRSDNFPTAKHQHEMQKKQFRTKVWIAILGFLVLLSFVYKLLDWA